MKKNVTMSDIAQQLKVSTVTVSKALSGKEGVSEETRQKIMKTAAEMGYSAKSAANPNRVIGVVVSERYMCIKNSFYWDMYQCLVQGLSDIGCTALLEVVTKVSESNPSMPNLLQNQQMGGLVVLGSFPKGYLDQLVSTSLPLVFLDFYDWRYDVDAIISDNLYCSHRLTNYLIQCGHKNIGYVGNIYALGNILDRYLGYYKAMTENRLDIRKEWILDDRDIEDRLFTDFVLPDELPTAFVCDCDETAYNFISFLSKHHISVPEDISIVGFDNYIYATQTNPSLTTIAVDIRRMAEETIRGLQYKMENPASRIGIKVVPGNLIVRDSVQSLSTPETSHH